MSVNTSAPEFVVKHPRKIGALVSVIGGLLLYFFYVSPFMQAHKGVDTITISAKGGVGGIAFLVVGLAYCMFGVKAVEFINPKQGNIGKGTIVFYVILCGIAIGCYVLFQNMLGGLGYTRH